MVNHGQQWSTILAMVNHGQPWSGQCLYHSVCHSSDTLLRNGGMLFDPLKTSPMDSVTGNIYAKFQSNVTFYLFNT